MPTDDPYIKKIIAEAKVMPGTADPDDGPDDDTPTVKEAEAKPAAMQPAPRGVKP